MFDSKIILPNGPQYMSDTPAPRHPGPDGDPPGEPAGPGDHPSLGSPGWTLVPQSPDWDEAWLAARAEDEYPGDPDEYEDPDNAPPPGLDDDELAALIAEAREVTAEQVRAAEMAARLGAHRGAGRGRCPLAPGGGARGCPGPRRRTPGSMRARPPGSPPASR